MVLGEWLRLFFEFTAPQSSLNLRITSVALMWLDSSSELLFAVPNTYWFALLRHIDLNEISLLSPSDINCVNMIGTCWPLSSDLNSLMEGKHFFFNNGQIVIVCICRSNRLSIMCLDTVIQCKFRSFTSTFC